MVKMHKIENKINKYKMLEISVEIYVKNCVHSIIDEHKMLWLRNKDGC